MQKIKVDKVTVTLLPTRQELGIQAARQASERIRTLLASQEEVNMIFAAAPSQNEFLEALSREPGIAWERVNAFHMDEYVGLPDDAPQAFGNFLKVRLFDKVPFKAVYYLDGNNLDPEAECQRYSRLLEQFRTDIVCMGIGENCHIAFNDPHVALFDDPVLVKQVALDQTSRQQQVHDGCFATLNDVPQIALTLTIPALVRAPVIFCMVPAAHKADAIYHTLFDPVSEMYPSTILRNHPNASLFIDNDSVMKCTALFRSSTNVSRS